MRARGHQAGTGRGGGGPWGSTAMLSVSPQENEEGGRVQTPAGEPLWPVGPRLSSVSVCLSLFLCVCVCLCLSVPPAVSASPAGSSQGDLMRSDPPSARSLQGPTHCPHGNQTGSTALAPLSSALLPRTVLWGGWGAQARSARAAWARRQGLWPTPCPPAGSTGHCHVQALGRASLPGPPHSPLPLGPGSHGPCGARLDRDPGLRAPAYSLHGPPRTHHPQGAAGLSGGCFARSCSAPHLQPPVQTPGSGCQAWGEGSPGQLGGTRTTMRATVSWARGQG